MRMRVDFAEQVVDDFDLVGDLGAAEDGDEGALGGFKSLTHVGKFLVHEQAGSGLRDEVGDAFGGGVGAVRGAERIVHIDLAEHREFLGELGVVLLFFGVVAKIFEQQDLS